MSIFQNFNETKFGHHTSPLVFKSSVFAIYNADINECSSNPCLNQGTCTDQVNGYVCNCQPGYTGVNCQIGKYPIQFYMFKVK